MEFHIYHFSIVYTHFILPFLHPLESAGRMYVFEIYRRNSLAYIYIFFLLSDTLLDSIFRDVTLTRKNFHSSTAIDRRINAANFVP